MNCQRVGRDSRADKKGKAGAGGGLKAVMGE